MTPEMEFYLAAREVVDAWDAWDEDDLDRMENAVAELRAACEHAGKHPRRQTA